MVHPEYTFQIIFQENRIERLILEAPEILSEFILDIKKQITGNDGKWILSHDGTLLQMRETCDLIMDPFSVDVNQRRMLSLLYAKLEQEINSTDSLRDWRQTSAALTQILENASETLEYDIVYNEEFDIKDYLKCVDVRFCTSNGNYVEQLLEYIQLTMQIRKIKIFVLVNITSLLTVTDIKYLYEQSFYKKFFLLLLDGQDTEADASVENKIIVDRDYCVIV